MELQVKDRDVVVPGQVVATGMEYLPSTGTYRLGDDIRANRLGLMKIEGKVLKTIPLAGVYLPQKNDVVIGKVIDILMSGWRLALNSPYSAVLQVKDATFDFIAKGADLTKYFDLEDHVVAKVIQVTSQNLVDVTCKGPGLKKLTGGRIIKVCPHKVPRIIGTKGSMVGMIKKATGCKIIIGQNGVIWMEGAPDKEYVAVETIRLIEELAHTTGLTERVKQHLVERTGVDAASLEHVEQEEEFGGSPDDRPRRYPREEGRPERGPPRGSSNDRRRRPYPARPRRGEQ
ncbi:RNA-binding protein [Candidatus Woesearchaeota archaeon]|nr:RNA-binding protein [Candidatus Woesearchaeota archaeon]